MIYKEILSRFGLPASRGDRDELRRLLAAEVKLARRWKDREEMLRTLCVLLFSLGEAEDSLLIWAAKRSNFDAGCGIVDVQFLCGAGLPATKSFLEHSDAPEAAKALQYLTECEATGDFQRFTPAAWVSSYRRYYGLDAGTRTV